MSNFEEAFAGFGRALDELVVSFQNFAIDMQHDPLQRYQMRRWIESLPTLGWIENGRAYLIVYNKQRPELSYIITDTIYET